MLKFSTGLLLMLASTAALAQTSLPTGYVFSETASGTLSVSTSSSRQAISSVATVLVTNGDIVGACVAYGDISVTAVFPCPNPSSFVAPGQSVYLAAGETITLPVSGSADVAAITGGGTTTLTLSQGYFAPTSVDVPVPTTVSLGGALVSTSNPIFVAPGSAVSFPVTGTFWQATQPVSAASLPLPTGAATDAELATINTTLGSPFQAGGSIGNSVFGATQSGTWTVEPGNTANTTPWLVGGTVNLGAGTAVVGTVGIDQTTPGTTNAVVATNFPETLDVNSGNASSSTLRVVPATDTPANPDIGQGAIGSTAPTGAQQLGVNDGGNLSSLVVCTNYKTVHVTSATNTLLVQGVASQSIRICGYHFSFAGSAAQAVFLENTASTNANCSSTNTQIANTVTGSASNPYADGYWGPFWTGLVNTNGNGLCVNTTGTGAVDVEISYAQY